MLLLCNLEGGDSGCVFFPWATGPDVSTGPYQSVISYRSGRAEHLEERCLKQCIKRPATASLHLAYVAHSQDTISDNAGTLPYTLFQRLQAAALGRTGSRFNRLLGRKKASRSSSSCPSSISARVMSTPERRIRKQEGEEMSLP